MLTLTRLDGLIVLIGMAAASYFYFHRKNRNIPNPPDQWISDVLNVGTLTILSLIIGAALARTFVEIPPLISGAISRAADANGVLLIAGFGNCIRVVAGGLLKSLAPEAAAALE